MACCKVIRRLALLHHARGLCHKQDVLQADHFQPRSALQLLATLEEHVTSSGKELLACLKDSLCWEKKELLLKNSMLQKEKEILQKEKKEKEEFVREKLLPKDSMLQQEEEILQKEKEILQKEEFLQNVSCLKMEGFQQEIKGLEAQNEILTGQIKLLQDLQAGDQVALLELKGLNDTRGLFKILQDNLVIKAHANTLKGSSLWEVIVKKNRALRLCIEVCTKISAKDEARQAAQCHAIYNLLSQHVHAGKALAKLQAAHGQILFQRGPMSPEQVKIFLCMGQAASVNIAEDPSTRLS